MILLENKHFGKLIYGNFIERLNRFVGLCKVGNEIEKCHIADTGRLKEILVKGKDILLMENKNTNKTKYKLLAVKMEEGFILVNTSYHSKIGQRLIENGFLGFKPKKIKREVRYNNSRIDFLIDDKVFVELKGCNLKIDDNCIFPDAPTERGLKHLKNLIQLKKESFESAIMVIAFRDCNKFLPNFDTDKKFSEYFIKAIEKDVKFYGFKVKFDNEFNIVYNGKILISEALWNLQKIYFL